MRETITWEDIAETLFATDGNGLWLDRTPLQEAAYTIRAKAIAELSEPTVAAQRARIAELEAALKATHEEIVLAMAFIGRDRGSKRFDATLDGLLNRFKQADSLARAAVNKETGE